MLAALAHRAEKNETVETNVWRRRIALDGVTGTVAVSLAQHQPNALQAVIRFPAVTALPSIVRRIRRVFDL
ncbi:AlkA N-terminal domain-containing protein, partial [Stenotrophomonas maltophilia]|uniref:AlkA N-terminal domain-containing protein n=1 Tax=Stenotrophomonas maltophilia TaxID=40324 RepID=UPI0023B7A29D